MQVMQKQYPETTRFSETDEMESESARYEWNIPKVYKTCSFDRPKSDHNFKVKWTHQTKQEKTRSELQ